MAACSAANGVLAYVFFALSTRALGAAAAAPVSVLWTYWGFAAATLTFPVQHWIVRAVAANGEESRVRRSYVSLAGLALVVAAVAGVAAWVGRDPLFHRPGAAFPLLVVFVTLGSALMGVVRGMLTARRRYAAVGAALVAENGLRVGLAIVLILTGSVDDRLFGLVLGIGSLAALFWPDTLRPEFGGERQPWGRFLASASGGQLIGQVVLTGGPVVLALMGGTPTEVTGLFTALALFRAPYTLALGAVSPLTGVFTRLVLAGQHATLRRTLAAIAGLAVVGVALAAVVGGLLGPWLLQLVFGPTVVVTSLVALLTAVGSVLALGTMLLSLMAMAHDRPHAMLRGWSLAIVAAVAVLLAGPGVPVTTVAFAFAAAQAVAFLVLLGGEAWVSSRATVGGPVRS
jgi:O-antigen/teichoic acid export membrane protein